MKEYRHKRGQVVHMTVYDCFEGEVKILKNHRHKVLVEIIDVLTCYPCQRKPLPGKKLWIEEKMIFHPEMIEHTEDTSWVPF
jgi:hypothetical protein